MKNFIAMTAVLFFIMIFIPLITLIGDDADTKQKNETVQSQKSTSAVLAESKNFSEPIKEPSRIVVTVNGKKEEMSEEEYVYGTVCAEMPASFHEEALKAQAVASYTYMKWLRENADNASAYESDITDNPAIHQAYLSEDELKKKWGNNYNIYSSKIKEAVNEVKCQYLTYNGETAMTVYHGLSTGKTADASDIWKSDIPYLRSVVAPGDKLSPNITYDVTLSEEEFTKPFSKAKQEDTESIFKNIKNNSDGFVSEITFKNTTLTATDLRSAYKLKSPFFKTKKNKDKIILTVYGKGHGVGMSQYSADYMARQGSTYKEILYHFYKGTVLESN